MEDARKEQAVVYDTIREEVRRRVDAFVEVAVSTHLDGMVREEVRKAVQRTRALRTYEMERQVRLEIATRVQRLVDGLRISLDVKEPDHAAS